jgi:hypothetical protein
MVSKNIDIIEEKKIDKEHHEEMNKLVEILMDIKKNEFEKFKVIMKHMIFLLDPK